MRPLLEILEQAPVFAGLTRAHLVALVPRMKGIRAQPGQHLVRQGEDGDAVFIVLDGRLAVRCEDGPWGSLRVAELGAGDVVGDMAWLDPGPRSASVRALETVHVARLDRSTYEVIVREAPALAVAILDGVAAVVAGRLERTNRMLVDVLGGDRGGGGAGAKAGADEGLPYAGEVVVSGLKDTPGFGALDMRSLGEWAPARVWGPGEVLCRQGEVGDRCFILVRGEVEVARELERDKVLARLGQGEVVGQLALIADGPRTATVRTVQTTVGLVLTRAALRRLIDSGAPAGLMMLERTVVAGIRQLRLANEVIARLLARPGGDEGLASGEQPRGGGEDGSDARPAATPAATRGAGAVGPDELRVQEQLGEERRERTRREVIADLRLEPGVASYDVDLDD